MKYLALGVAAAALLGLGGCAHHQQHMRQMENTRCDCAHDGHGEGAHQHPTDCPRHQH